VSAEAASVRGHSTHGGSRHSGWHSGPYYSYSYGYYGYPYAYGYAPFYSGYRYYPGYPGGYYGQGYGEISYIDTDIQPEDTEVILDGKPVGTVDDFDGFPRYLAVTAGKHQLTFRAEGRVDVTRSIRVPRGALLQLDFTLPREGESSRRGISKEDEIVIPDPPPGEPDPSDVDLREHESEPDADEPESYDSDEDRMDSERPDADQEDEMDEPDADEPGFVKVQVSPGDASVYLDGKLIGSASKLSALHGEMRIEPGVHRVEAVRPGFRAGSKRVLVGAGEHLTVELELQKSSGPPR